MNDQSERWEAVGRYVQSHMLRLGLKQKELAQKARLSAETIRPFTNGVPATRDASSASKLSLALGLPGDRIARILDGSFDPDNDEEPDVSLSDRVALLEQLVGELRPLVLRLLGTHQDDAPEAPPNQ